MTRSSFRVTYLKATIIDAIEKEIPEFVRINNGDERGLDNEGLILVAARAAVNTWNHMSVRPR